MTTAFQSEQYYTADELEIMARDAKLRFRNLQSEPRGKAMTILIYIFEAADRHNVPLNTGGYTSPENGCYQCGKAMHYTELDKLAERGLPPDTCLRCHHNGDCPTCHGTGEVGTGKRLLSHDWHDAPEYDASRCEDCNGCGDYDSYCVVNGVE